MSVLVTPTRDSRLCLHIDRIRRTTYRYFDSLSNSISADVRDGCQKSRKESKLLKGLGMRHRQMFTVPNLHVLACLVYDRAVDWANCKLTKAEPGRGVRMEIVVETAKACGCWLWCGFN